MQSEKTKKIKWARSLGLILSIALLPFVVVYFAIRSQYSTTTISVRGVTVKAQIATTSQQKQRGLCCRDSLPQNAGMLFVYETPENHRFWMKDTRIPLDIYWLDAKKNIVHIEHDVQPSSFPKTYGTDIPSQYVLETNAGFAKKHGIRVGDKVAF